VNEVLVLLRNYTSLNRKCSFFIKMRSKKELEEAICGATSMSQVLRNLKLNKSSGTMNTIRKQLQYYNIKTEFIKRARNTQKYTFNEIFCDDSTYDRTTLRNKLIKENIIEYKCKECGIIDWNNNPLSLQLDHINGKRKDNRLENLRFLCPNCHSQTSTWGNKKSG